MHSAVDIMQRMEKKPQQQQQQQLSNCKIIMLFVMRYGVVI